jgi:hypothetical protein
VGREEKKTKWTREETRLDGFPIKASPNPIQI